jgi:hypothetical protein
MRIFDITLRPYAFRAYMDAIIFNRTGHNYGYGAFVITAMGVTIRPAGYMPWDNVSLDNCNRIIRYEEVV